MEPVVEELVALVQRDGAAGLLLDVAGLVDVIEVGVRVHDPLHRQVVVLHDLEDARMKMMRFGRAATLQSGCSS